MTKMTSDDQRLQNIGYTDKLPMSITVAAHYEVNNEQQLLENAKQALTLSANKDTVLATTLPFPYEAQKSFELIIDDEFIAQQRGIKIHNCNDFKITAENIIQSLHKATKFFIEISHCHSFIIENIDTVEGLNIFIISHSHQFQIRKCSIKQAEGYAIIIHQSSQFEISSCLLENNLGAGIMVLGESKNGLINDCQCRASTGYFNCDAGIHLCASSEAITLAEIPEQCHEALSIEEKTCRPYAIVIENCVLNYNRAQGIYLEGAVNCLLQHNQILNNNKEGICLDWGSCHNIVKHNLIAFNGERKNMSNEELVADFIIHYPVLKDGSSSMKLAGISIDNGCMNLLAKNNITHNYGGGIKFIRAGLFNVIDKNFIVSNALGINKYTAFFCGISVNGMGAINKEFSNCQMTLVDFLPSQLNNFSENFIKGHFLSIYCDKICTHNNLKNNMTAIHYAYKTNWLIIGVLAKWIITKVSPKITDLISSITCFKSGQ